MASTQSPKAPRVRQARKSLAAMPSTEFGGDKENMTVDSAMIAGLGAHGKQAAKKSRSKSIGPGGLDALKEEGGNKQPSLPPFVRSILKPTIALSPPKTIPPHKGARGASPGKARGQRTPEKSPRKSAKEPPRNGGPGLQTSFDASPKPTATNTQSPSRSPARVAVRTEEEQQAAAKERERQEALAHRDARRKSLASRRVSFAPEATLHTWNVVELPEDSTTSSASTNSTRRASGLRADAESPYPAHRSPMPSSDASEPTSTPPERVEELQVAASPAHQRDLHQKKRRKNSGIPPMDFNKPEDFSSSPCSGADDDTNQTIVTADEVDKDSESSTSNDDDVVEEETVTGIDVDNNTIRSTGSNSTGSSGRLEAALQQAAHQAGTQGIDYDEHGDITMEMADDEVTNAFKPWMQDGKYVSPMVNNLSALQEQENTNPFSPAFKANMTGRTQWEGDGTMAITQAVGGIITTTEDIQVSPMRQGRKSVTGSNRRRSSVARRRSSGDGSVMCEETMDLTVAVGGIKQVQQVSHNWAPSDNGSADDDEELTMEFTSVIGGVVQPDIKHASFDGDHLANQQLLGDLNSRESGGFSDNDETMDITFAAGGILPSITERTEPMEDQTQDMDITTAVGAILPKQVSTSNEADAKLLTKQEADLGLLPDSPIFGTPRQKPIGAGLTDERPLPGHVKAMASETGSPSLTASQPRGQARKSVGPQSSVAPTSPQPTSLGKSKPPSKQLTPQLSHPTTPGKTPPSRNVSMRTASPKKLFVAEIKADAKKLSNIIPRPTATSTLVHKDLVTGATTPSIVLKPRRRRSSGLGIDREGIGSPRVTTLLDRRESISDKAEAFVSQGPASASVRFEDPQLMAQQLDLERSEDKRRESGREILKDEADVQDLEERDATANLKDLIETLTPQKKKLNGRKSLHVGAARGLLGKRPAELDDDVDEDGPPKRLKGREGSPVKKVKLPAPPGRVTRSTRLSLVDTTGNARASTPSGNGSPQKTITTPKDQPRFKEVESGNLAKVTPFEQKLEADTKEATEPSEGEDRIHLQDFLNMTSIRFMELTTTKRRHTIAPNALLEQKSEGASLGAEDAGQADESNELEKCVVAGACTVPMLELYQHSCRELKNYIAEGRSIVKEIEADTYEENPPLFREYMSAPPDVKPIIDNQFKNVKTHARLLSKAMWYEWRMKLLDGLKEGLLRVAEGMDDDDRILIQQEQMLEHVLPGLIEKHEHLENEVQIAQAQADELASCDQDELKDARDSLMSMEMDLEAKQKLVEDLQTELREKENILGDVLERKQDCTAEIKEAERICQDCRGWTAAEVSALHANVKSLEATHGWAITSTTDSSLAMTYNNTLQLLFTPSSFAFRTKPAAPAENSPISLTYIADTHPYHPKPLTTEKRFFLQIMRAQLQCLQQSQTSVKDLLAFISTGWETASNIVEEARVLGVSYITESTITSDEAMAVRARILLQAMRTNIEVVFEVKVRGGEGVAALGVAVKAGARVCYGEGLKEKKMAEFLESRIKGAKGKGGWVIAVGELEQRLKDRGRKV